MIAQHSILATNNIIKAIDINVGLHVYEERRWTLDTLVRAKWDEREKTSKK